MLLVLLSSKFWEYNQGCRSKIRVHGSQANFNAKSCFWMCCGLFMQGPCFMPFLSDGILGVVSYCKEKRRTTWKNPGFHGFLIIPNLCTESSSGHSIVYLPRACPQVDLTVSMLGANNQLLLPWGQGWFWCIASHLSKEFSFCLSDFKIVLFHERCCKSAQWNQSLTIFLKVWIHLSRE